MGIELPAELAEVAAKAGVSWPQADEDALRTSAAAWRDAGAKLATLAAESDGSAGRALAAMSGPTGEAARGHWNTFTAPDGKLNTAVRGCHAAADRLDHAAEQVGATKVELVRELVNLAKNNDAAQQAAGAGHPTALLGLDTAVRGTAANVAHLTDTLTSAVRMDSGVQVGGHQPPVDTNPGAQGPADVSAPAQGHGGGQGNGGLVSGLVGGVIGGGASGGGLTAPVVQAVDAVAPPLAAAVTPLSNTTENVVRDIGNTADRAVQGAAEALTPGRDNAPGQSGAAPGRDTGPALGNLVGEALNPVVGNVAAPVVDAVTRTEGTVSQASAAVLDRPAPHPEAPHAPAPPAAPVNQPTQQGPTFSGPTGGSPAAGPAAAAAAVAPSPAGTAPAQQGQAAQQAAARVEARAAQAAPQPGQTPAGQGQAGQGSSSQQAQAGPAKAEAAVRADAQAKAEAGTKADAPAKGEAQAKGEPSPGRPRDLKDALPATAQQAKDGALGFAVLPIPAGGRDTIDRSPLPGPTSAILPTERDDAPPQVRAAQTAEPSTEAVALFLLHMFPGGMLPQPGRKPARQLPPPSEDQAFAAGLRFEPQGHPDGHLVDASARIGLDLRFGGHDRLRSRLAGSAEQTTHPEPARNRPRLVLAPGTAPDPALLDGYDPLAGMHERDWDHRFLVRADPPEYAWPPGEMFPEGGYEAGQAGVLAVGVELDRFGAPEGRVLSERGTAFAARSLPPALAAAGYHRYRVIKLLPVWFTLSAEWFGQPGGGVRYRTTYPVADLLALGYLEEIR